MDRCRLAEPHHPQGKRNPLLSIKADVLFLIAIPVVLLVGLVAANTIGGIGIECGMWNYHRSWWRAEQPAPVSSQPAATP